eukprot:m.101632 g.101632  ORF g.101632 m.101632 type:complete len:202 (-) comp16813_c0_seq5:744-1349(-)
MPEILGSESRILSTMGITTSYPLDETSFCYELPDQKPVDKNYLKAADETHYYIAQKPHWNVILDQRSKCSDAKRKLNETSITDYLQRYETWSEADVLSLRDQFMSFDTNCDGLIDYHELNTVLDNLGDTTSVEDRREYFSVIDADDSEGIDFEEFLQLVHGILVGTTQEWTGFDRLCEETLNQKSACNRLSITQQVAAGLV